MKFLVQCIHLYVVATTSHKDKYCCGDYKRTQQGVSAELLSYLYKLQIVHANIT